MHASRARARGPAVPFLPGSACTEWSETCTECFARSVGCVLGAAACDARWLRGALPQGRIGSCTVSGVRWLNAFASGSCRRAGALLAPPMPPVLPPWRSPECQWLQTGDVHGYKVFVGDLPATISEAEDILKGACIKPDLLEWFKPAGLGWRCARLTYSEEWQARWSFQQLLKVHWRSVERRERWLSVQWARAPALPHAVSGHAPLTRASSTSLAVHAPLTRASSTSLEAHVQDSANSGACRWMWGDVNGYKKCVGKLPFDLRLAGLVLS